MTAQTQIAQLEASLDRAYAEIERLRAALTEIAGYDYDPEDGMRWQYLARTALNQQLSDIS